jgi:anti-sigma factor RsiW
MKREHLSDGDLERYVTGMIHHDAELKSIEDHLFACPDCTERMWSMQEQLDGSPSGSLQTADPDLYRKRGPVQ